MKTHELKTDRLYFQSTLDGEKLFEIRKNDRDFKKGDAVILRETVHSSHRMASHNAPLEYTGRTMKASISSVYGYYNVDGIEKGFVVFGLADLTVINYQDES